MARYATESRVRATPPALALPVRVFGVIAIMYKVNTPFHLCSRSLVSPEIFPDQIRYCCWGTATGYSCEA